MATIAFIAGIMHLARPPDRDHLGRWVFEYVGMYRSAQPVPPLRFLLTATSLNPIERRLQGTLTLLPSEPDDRPTFVDANGLSVEQTNGVLRAEFVDAKLLIYIGDASLRHETIYFPLRHVVNPQAAENSSSVSVSIPLHADPSQFPNDTYTFALYLDVRTGPGVAATPPRHANASVPLPVWQGSVLPVTFGIAVDERLGQWNLGTNAVVTSTKKYSPAVIKGGFSRGWAYWAFIYSISLMPAVIGLSFFVRTRRRRGGTNDTSAAMELAAALLALIALRQVFVPTDIVGLTRLDFVLGVQLLVVCWLMAVTYVAEPPALPSPPKPKARSRTRRPIPRLPAGAVRR
ncbi:hypothetical protein ACWGE0_02435 [Lentzea sp. NPDC054927]